MILNTVFLEGFSETFEKCFIRDDRYKLLISGIGVTVKVALLAAAMGLVIGFLIALCNLSKKKPLNLLGKVYTDVIRGTPSVTQLMIIYFVVALVATVLVEILINGMLMKRRGFKNVARATMIANVVSYLLGCFVLYTYSFVFFD